MANSKISALPAASTPLAGTEVLPVVQGGITEQVSVANLTAGRDVSASGLFVDANSATSAVRITQLGAGNALTVEDSANPDATPFVVDANGAVIAGYTSRFSAIDAIAVQSAGSATQLGFSAYNWNATGVPRLAYYKSTSGTTGTYGTSLASGTNISFWSFYGDDGTAFVEAARITSAVDGTTGVGDMPGRLVFSTTADGASSPTERVRISNFGGVGVGGAATAGQILRVGGSLTGNTSARQVIANGVVASDVTARADSFYSTPQTAASAFTLGILSHFHAVQSTIGATSSVTTQIGFEAESSLVGATTNYGFYGNIPAAANRYNFYAAGTAQNLFSGDVLVFGAGGLGYSTGSGGAVTQLTSRTTGVTLNKTNGAITLFTAVGTAVATTFTVTNSTVAATDVVNVCQKSGTNLYNTLVTAVAAGSFNITFFTTGGIASDAPVFNFAVTKAVAA